MSSFLYQIPSFIIVTLLLVLMLAANGLGFYLHQKQLKRGQDGTVEGLGPIEGSLLP